METLTFKIPEEPSSYFLEFSSKEEYLQKREEWRKLYKWLSHVIRYNKKVTKSRQSAFSKVRDRMAKKGWSYYSTSRSESYAQGLSEYESRTKIVKNNLPSYKSCGSLDATEMLKIRKEMKEESRAQRDKVMEAVATIN